MTRIIEVENSDKTGTNDYSFVRITRDTALLSCVHYENMVKRLG